MSLNPQIDLRNDKTNWNKTAGFTEQETSAFARILAGPTATSTTLATAFATTKKETTSNTEKVVETHTTTVVASNAEVDIRDTETIQSSVQGDSQDKVVIAATVAATTSSSPQTVAGAMVDVWRKLHPKDEHYSYFSYRFGARQKGMGWRIDHCEYNHFVAS